jgi:chromosome partitioning protein
MASVAGLEHAPAARPPTSRGPRRIALLNEKGGSAKTTLTVNLAAHLTRNRGRRVLALDMDPQGQLGKSLGAEVRRVDGSALDLLGGSQSRRRGRAPRRLPLVSTHLDGLDIVVANHSLALFPLCANEAQDNPSSLLARTLDGASELASYEYLLIDAPSSCGLLTLTVLRAVDEIVVPVPLTYLGLDSCSELVRMVAAVRRRFGHERLRISMVIPTFYRRTRLANEILERLQARFPKQIAHTVVGYHVKIDEAQSRGVSIFEYAPRDRGAEVMAVLAEELELRGQSHDGKGGEGE